MELTTEETNVQGSAMVTYLHQQLAQAFGEIASLKGQSAILEYKLAKALAPVAAPDPISAPETPVE